MTILTFSIKIDGLEDDSLVVRQFEGHESLSDSVFLHNQICHGFSFNIALASRRHNLIPEQIVDKTAVLTLYQDLVCVQRWHGVVRSFTQGETGYNYSFYSLVLVPAFERLSLRHNSRIFQQQNAEDIISTLLNEMEIQDFSFKLSRQCQTREFCVQYRETDLDFVQRLAAEEGMIYHIEHSDDKHTLVFSDNSSSLPSLAQPVVHNALAGGMFNEPFIYYFEQHTQSNVAEVIMQDRSFKKPDYNFAQNAIGKNLSFQRANYTYFDFPGRFKDDRSGKAFNQYRLEYLRREAQTAQGKSNQPLLQAGVRFTLSDHLNPTCNKEWIVVRVMHKGEQAQALEEEAGDGVTSYHNECKFIPATQTWRATPQPKPIVDGPMVAEVVGPAGEEIYCDEHGRVKVHFPWDRDAKKDDKSSCWVRVTQAWAGGQYGMMAIPRIGHEVIVSFLHGDPDQPIITGCTYHATNVTPDILPNHQTRTTIRTKTHKGEGFNELRFEDKTDDEQIFIHAQKNIDQFVKEISREEVGKSKHVKVKEDNVLTVNGSQHRKIEKDDISKISGAKHLTVQNGFIQKIGGALQRQVNGIITKIIGAKNTQISGSEHTSIGSDWLVSVGNNTSVSAKSVVLEAGDELSIKGSGGFIKIDSSGVTISGNKVKINSGGSPTTSSPPEEKDPESPASPDEAQSADKR